MNGWFNDAMSLSSTPKAGEWVSVNDGLPNEGEGNRVIIFADKRPPFNPEVLWGYYEARQWYTQWGRCDRVTHWQPLPAPPLKQASKPDREGQERVCEVCETPVFYDNGDVTYSCICNRLGWCWRPKKVVYTCAYCRLDPKVCHHRYSKKNPKASVPDCTIECECVTQQTTLVDFIDSIKKAFPVSGEFPDKCFGIWKWSFTKLKNGE